MSFNSDVHPVEQVQGRHRRSIRLKEYDYAQPGAYFITIVTHEREPLFGEIELDAMRLNAWGEMARDEWFKTAELRSNITLYEDEFVVMPNHVHGVIWINKVGAERRSAPTPIPHVTAGSLGAVVRAYKSAVTYVINGARQTRGEPIWQRNYYEHIVRNDADLNRIRDYIANNPLKWVDDDLYF
ncbi:MAG: transposase [Chloroflexota bacterium]